MDRTMDGELLLKLYRQMMVMRRFEEEAAKAYTERKIGGFLHLYIGQEALGAGVIAATQPQDYIISAYRIHAQYLARGGTPRAGMAELFGKETGCAKGRGGSMHFYNTAQRFMGGWGIVGAHVPIAAGMAYASKYKNEDAVTICFLCEGAVNIGPFHEGLCLAALWRLPVIFVIENNGYAMGTPAKRALVTEDASIRALGYPMARATVDGWDVTTVYATAKEAIDRARKESLPMLLEYKTYRYRGHSMADPGKYRTKEELEDWKKRDPIELAKRRLINEYPALGTQFDSIDAEVEAEIQDAVQFAENSPEPDPSTLTDYTYIVD
ncbi:MAG: pyruvate dehydrogenase (acetyl-transferring) E1 component subunit alpha [Deltaproteobacteria bacterium]|nr:pyruvate dehydrogenase (acetyl-transferring) E1 component subunit alpha [Deltaproteobacteria bacterium]